MSKHPSTLLGVFAAAALLAFVAPVYAQDSAAEQVPTVKDPIRFTAIAVQMSAGASGQVQISVERWSTEEERKALIALVGTATDKPGGQDQLLEALQNIKVRTGFIRLPNTMGWDLKYAYQTKLEDGSRQIVIATDKPVSFLSAASNARAMDYPFSLIEMRFPAGKAKGEGKLLGRTSISTKDGKLALELYGTEATRLTSITQKKSKKK